MNKKDNPFKKAIDNHKQEHLTEGVIDLVDVGERAVVITPVVQVIDVADDAPANVELSPIPKKRGRPATGKRSDDSWIGRTYYIQRDTDLDIEDQLLKLKRSGVDIDKSELVDFLLATWVKLQKGENSDFRISEISAMRK